MSYRAQYGINACRFLFFVQSFGNLLLARGTDLFRHYEMIHLSAILKLRSETLKRVLNLFVLFIDGLDILIEVLIEMIFIIFFKCID